MEIFDIFNDIVKILNSISVMENYLKKSTSDTKEFIKDFKSDNLPAAQSKLDSLNKDFNELERIFKDCTLMPAMDLYQKIKQLLHLHVAHSEKQLIDLKSNFKLNEAQNLLKLIDKNKKDAA